jgi:hypothetical protein
MASVLNDTVVVAALLFVILLLVATAYNNRRRSHQRLPSSGRDRSAGPRLIDDGSGAYRFDLPSGTRGRARRKH